MTDLEPTPPPVGRVSLRFRGGPRDGEEVDGVVRYVGWDEAGDMHTWAAAFPVNILQLIVTGVVTAHMDVLPARTSIRIETLEEVPS